VTGNQDYDVTKRSRISLYLHIHRNPWAYPATSLIGCIARTLYLYPTLTVYVHGTLTPLFPYALVWCLDTGTNLLFTYIIIVNIVVIIIVADSHSCFRP